jgi:hypothetical protein
MKRTLDPILRTATSNVTFSCIRYSGRHQHLPNRNFRSFYINSDAYEYRLYRRQYRPNSLHDSATLKTFPVCFLQGWHFTDGSGTQLPMQIAPPPPSVSPFHLSFKTIHKLLRHSASVINHRCSFTFILLFGYCDTV